MEKYNSEMRLFDPRLGQRLYLDEKERELFLIAAEKLDSRNISYFAMFYIGLVQEYLKS